MLPPGSSIIAAQECDLIHHRGLCNCAVGIGSAGGGSGSKVANSHERDNGPATGIFEFVPERAVGRCLEFGAEDRTPSFTEWLTCCPREAHVPPFTQRKCSVPDRGFLSEFRCMPIYILG